MKFKNGMVVYCDTKEKAIEFLKECHKQGWIWISGRKIINENGKVHSNYNDYESNTKYYLDSQGLSYGRFCNVLGDKAISFDDLFKVKEEQKKCKIYKENPYIKYGVEKVIINEPSVIVILKSGEKGISKCHPDDVFNERLGYEVAYKRAKIKELKKEIEGMEVVLDFLTR